MKKTGHFNVRNEAGHILMDIGVPVYLKGFPYMTRAVEIYHDNPKLKRMQVYAKVANEYGLSIEGVRQALRKVIKMIDPKSAGYKKYGALRGIEEKKSFEAICMILFVIAEAEAECR